MIHNKLVRDKIPAEIEARGATCTFDRLNDRRFLLALVNKLVEESDEVRVALMHYLDGGATDQECLQELADLQSVLDCFMHTMGFSSRQLNDEVCRKMQEKGRFTERILLIESREVSR